MPVSVKRSPFRDLPNGMPAPPASLPPVQPDLVLREHQIRVLEVLRPEQPDDPEILWPILRRDMLRVALDYSPTNSLNRILNHKETGLLPLGLIEEVIIDCEGRLETNYRITKKGIECLSRPADAKSLSDNGSSDPK